MSETEVDLNTRIAGLEKRLSYVNNRSMLIALLALLSIGMNVWSMLRPLKSIRLADGASTAELTPTGLTLRDQGRSMEIIVPAITIKTGLGTGRYSALGVTLEEPGGVPYVMLSVAPGRRTGKAGFLALHDDGGPSAHITGEEWSKFATTSSEAGVAGK